MGNNPDPTRNLWHFEDMLQYAGEAVSILKGRSLSELENDRVTQLALLRCIEVFGEAAARVPLAHRPFYPQLPWKEAVSTRNRLIHGYDAVRLDVVHAIVSAEFPKVIPQLKVILKNFSQEGA